MSERLQNLEERCAYQDKLLSDLNQVVITLQAKIDVLERELMQLKESSGVMPVGKADEPPPHY